LRRGEIIVRYGDEEIREAAALRNLVAGTPINNKVPVSLWRNGKRTEVTVVIKELPE